jgi:hypothetical protein
VLFWTIWIALVLFVVAQYGQRASTSGRGLPRWVLWTNAIGIALCVSHIVITMGSVHGWSHAAAIEATARQTQSVYGLRWGGGVHFNYLFVAAWAVDAWWHARANGRAGVPLVRKLLRVFFLIVIVNAAVVFARPHTRCRTGRRTVVRVATAPDLKRKLRRLRYRIRPSRKDLGCASCCHRSVS